MKKLRKLRQSVDFGSNEKISELDESKEGNYPPSPRITKKGGGPKSRGGVLTIAEVANGDRSGASSPSPSDGTYVRVLRTFPHICQLEWNETTTIFCP